MKNFWIALSFLSIVSAGGNAAAQNYNVSQVTNNTTNDGYFFLNNNDDVLWAGWDGTDFELFLYTAATGTTEQLTNNLVDDNPMAFNNRGDVAWYLPAVDALGNPVTNLMRRDATTKLITQLNTGPTAGWVISMNAAGDVAWTQVDAVPMVGAATTLDVYYYNNATQVVKNVSNSPGITDESPQLNNQGDIIWVYNSLQDNGEDAEIYRYNASTNLITNISNNTVTDTGWSLQLNQRGDIAWGTSETDANIYLYEALTNSVTRITPDNLAYDTSPSLSANGDVTWLHSGVSGYELYYFNNQSRASNYVAQINSNPGRFTSSGDYVFHGPDPLGLDSDIFKYKPVTGEIINLTNDDLENWSWWLNANGDVSWTSYTGNGSDYTTYEINTYDSATGTQTRLTSNIVYDDSPIINNNGTVVWYGWDGTDYEIFMAKVASIPDTDGDGVPDNVDNCTLVANPDQYDANGDGFGNLCDGDLNNDNVVNFGDYGIFRQRLGTTDAEADFNHDGVVNLGDYGIFRTLLGSAPGPAGILP